MSNKIITGWEIAGTTYLIQDKNLSGYLPLSGGTLTGKETIKYSSPLLTFTSTDPVSGNAYLGNISFISNEKGIQTYITDLRTTNNNRLLFYVFRPDKTKTCNIDINYDNNKDNANISISNGILNNVNANTQSQTNNSTNIATTEFVHNIVSDIPYNDGTKTTSWVLPNENTSFLRYGTLTAGTVCTLSISTSYLYAGKRLTLKVDNTSGGYLVFGLTELINNYDTGKYLLNFINIDGTIDIIGLKVELY